ncbi:MAG: hypothetical protein NC079_01645 [Clostridium sp.]|nr:hypothetical protein [Acetatifactor muris]MCM1526582.1 hypothetical protein [Bacteroides sp.]MCM1562292.1 hypothetical protein [Clostridium sp.]
MLTILLKILGILGIVLLVVLGVVLALILLVLFVPVSYRVNAERKILSEGDADGEPQGKGDGESEGGEVETVRMSLSVRARWLLGFLRARFDYPDPGTFRVKILFWTLYDSGREEQEPETSKPPERSSQPETAAQAEEPRQPGQSEQSGQPEQAESSAQPDPAPEPTRETDGSRLSPFEKLRYTFRGICDRIKTIRDDIAYYKAVLTDEDTRGLLNHALTRLGKVLKSIRPRRLKADIRFGTGSPDTTGYAFGVYGMLCTYLGQNVLLTPDFERAVLEGELYAAGRITVCKLLWHGAMLALDKRLWELISKLKREDRAVR